jgi:mercuric ion transport protein
MAVEKTIPGGFSDGSGANGAVPGLESKSGAGPLALGGLAAIVASVCCVVPLLLVSVGLGGAWLANVQILAPYRWVFLSVAGVALLFAYRRIYRPVAECAPGEACALPQARRTYKIVFWLVAALVAASASIPYWAALSRVSGVVNTEATFASKEVVVTFDDRKTTEAALMKATGEAGFPSTVKK